MSLLLILVLFTLGPIGFALLICGINPRGL
jgi:hypothetical protein